MRSILVTVALAACAAPSVRPADRGWADELDRDVVAGRARVVSFFGAPFPKAFRLVVLPDRAALDRHWGFTSQCWMVGSGLGGELSILSPAAWPREACEHDPKDHAAIARLVTHELVHTYHQQVNPRLESDAAAAESVGWFIEGLAVYASGQLDDGHLAPAAEAIAKGRAPTRLADAWTGKYKYGVSGSLVGYIDHTWGRPMLIRLLRASSMEEILAALGVSEEELLSRWRASVSVNTSG